MDVTLIVSLMAIIISLYGIAPEYQKRNIRYKFSIIRIFIIASLSSAFLYFIILQGYFEKSSETINISLFNLVLEKDYFFSLLALLVMIILAAYCAYIIFNRRVLSKRKFIDNLRINYTSSNYDILIVDLNFFLKEIMIKYKTNNTDKSFSTKEHADGIMDFFSDILQDVHFVKELSIKNPAFGNRLIHSPVSYYIKMQFVELFMRELVLNNKSVLYRQIHSSQLLDKNLRYIIKKENYLLFTFFNNITVSETLHPYKGVGDAVIFYLQQQQKKVDDTENMRLVDYYDNSFTNPIGLGIHFFNLMVNKGLDQNSKSHLWLYYFAFFTDEICKNIKYMDGIEDGEFNNMYEYYLYLIFGSYKDWISRCLNEEMPYTPETPKINEKQKTAYSESSPSDIIRAAILSLVESMDYLSRSDNVRTELKLHLMHIILDLYFSLVLSKNSKANNYGQFMLNTIKERIAIFDKTKKSLSALIQDSVNTLDEVPIVVQEYGYEKLAEFIEKLELKKK